MKGLRDDRHDRQTGGDGTHADLGRPLGVEPTDAATPLEDRGWFR